MSDQNGTSKIYKNWDDAPVLLSTEQAAGLMQIHLNTMKRWLYDGKIPGARKIGRDWRIDKASLRRWFEEVEPER